MCRVAETKNAYDFRIVCFFHIIFHNFKKPGTHTYQMQKKLDPDPLAVDNHLSVSTAPSFPLEIDLKHKTIGGQLCHISVTTDKLIKHEVLNNPPLTASQLKK